jgi:alanyl-tRNA synthetase
MALRLYRTDAYLKEFTARVVEQVQHNGHPALILDQTAFYPTSGGQPNDLGEINDLRVLDVVERTDGEILHMLDLHTLPPGERDGVRGEVSGVINWPRRFEHMQQHSGQHVLSQAFVRVANLDTVAVHISADENTLDLPTPKLAADVIERAEREANAIICEDRPFVIYEVANADLSHIPLRKPPKVAGLIRIVEVKDYDWSACGGTHVRSAAQIGLIKITKAEKRGNETRVTFRCGVRALRDYARLNDATTRLSELLSASRYEIEPAVVKLANEAKTDRKALQAAQLALIGYETAELLVTAKPVDDGVRTIARAFESRDMNELRILAKQLTATSKTVALLGTAGEKAQLIFARSKDAPGDMADMLKRALSMLSPAARGGGSADFAQGGGVPADATALTAAIRAAQGFDT